jgi:hypothetical protein
MRTTSVVVLSLAVLGTACNLVKKDETDASGPAPTTPPATAATTAATTTAPATTDTAPAPLGTTTTTVAPTPGHPTVVTDAGKPTADAGPAADGGAKPPTPTPTLPTIPGFDAGGFKPPQGFPSTIPTWPPPPAK